MDNYKRTGIEFIIFAHLIRREMDKNGHKKCVNGMTMNNAKLISYIFRHRNCDIFQKDLEDAFSLRPPTVSRSLKQLEEQGFIVRLPLERDSRLKKITLTEKSQKISESFEEVVSDIFQKMTKGIPQDEMDEFIRTLRKMKKNLMEE